MPPMPTYGGVPGIDLPYPDPLRQRAAFGLPGTPPYPPQASLNHIPEYPSPQGHTAPYSQRPSSHYSPYPINSPFPQQMVGIKFTPIARHQLFFPASSRDWYHN